MNLRYSVRHEPCSVLDKKKLNDLFQGIVRIYQVICEKKL